MFSTEWIVLENMYIQKQCILKVQQGGTIREAIDWDSLDGQKIHTIIAMFIPENEAGSTHLTILSQVARMLMKEDFKKAIQATTSKTALLQVMNQYLEGN